MKRFLFFTILFFFLFGATIQGHGAEKGSEKKASSKPKTYQETKPFETTYHALIIGNNQYRHLPKLKTARNDAIEVDRLLKEKFGFKTELLLDATRASILDRINGLRKELREKDNLLIYYAGHGEFDKTVDKAYWLPIDAQPDYNTNWIIADDITSNIKRIAAQHILVISDSCYSGSLTRQAITALLTGERAGYIKKMQERPSRTLMASGGNEPVLDSGGGNNSIFAAAFLKSLKESDKEAFTAEEVFHGRIKPIVAGKSDQVPEYSSIKNSGDEGGDFVFRLVKMEVDLKPAEPIKVLSKEVIDQLEKERQKLTEERVKLEGERKKLEEQIKLEEERVKVAEGKALLESKKREAEEQHRKQQEALQKLAEEKKRLEKQLREEEIRQKLEMEKKADKPTISIVDPAVVSRPSQNPPEPSTPSTSTDSIIGMEFVLVNGGCYQMGDTFGDGGPDEKPIHEVCVDDFWMGKYEVTVGEFKKFVLESNYKTEAEKEGWGSVASDDGIKYEKKKGATWRNPGFDQGDRNPVVLVSWNDAKAFIEWLIRKTGKHYRLPTEAEWEYAARNGGKGYKYSWGNSAPEGNIAGEEIKRRFPKRLGPTWEKLNDEHVFTAPVGSFKPNELGLYDMTGNVWEMCQDIYADKAYDKHSRNNPIYNIFFKGSGSPHVHRGGGWNTWPRDLRVTKRFPFILWNNSVGFRLAGPIEAKQVPLENERVSEEKPLIKEDPGSVKHPPIQRPAESLNRITNSIGMEFVLIPSGSFIMGSPADEPGRSSDEIQHRVTITKPYFLQTTEVTQGQWKAIMGNNPSFFTNCGDDCPVENVSWNEVKEFIDHLNNQEKTDKYRLPSEAEWEYAARAGTITSFNTGKCISTDQANYNGKFPISGCPDGENRSISIKVASFPPNVWGLYDMLGNVREWCQDRYGAYPEHHVTDPTGPWFKEVRVSRGGSWDDIERNLRSSKRKFEDPWYRNYNLGFRIGRD